MSERIVQHAHCEICGKVVNAGTRWCSPDCTAQYEEGQKLKKRQAILIVLMVLFVLGMPYVIENFR